MNRELIYLYDLDSTIYLSVYKIVNRQDIEGWFYDGRTKEWMRKEIVNLSINRMSQIIGNVLTEIEDTGIEMKELRYYITQSKYPIRRWVFPEYKSGRQRNKWVSLVRKELMRMDFAKVSDTWEADDLIVSDAKKIGAPNFLIISQDKDYDQLEGLRFNDSRPRTTEVDENGFRIKLPCKGLTLVTSDEAHYNFWLQVLIGDLGDNIKGVPGIGIAKGKKILNNRKNLMRAVYECYLKKYQDSAKFEFCKNHFLIKLGIER